MKLPDQGEIFGAADEKFDSGEIGGLQSEGGGQSGTGIKRPRHPCGKVSRIESRRTSAW